MPFVVIVVVLLLVGIYVASLMTSITIWEYQRGVKFTKGKFEKLLEPGKHKFSPRNSEVKLVDVRQKFQTVEGQEVMSSDGVGLKVSLVLQYVVADPYLALTKTDAYERAMHLLVQIALREVLSSKPIDELVQSRAEIGTLVLQSVASKGAEIGLEVQSVSVKDLMFPGPLKQTMAKVVEARKDAEAALERARGEAATLRSLANTARLLDKDPSLMQLRMLQAFAETKGNTLILNMTGSVSPVEVIGKTLPEQN